MYKKALILAMVCALLSAYAPIFAEGKELNKEQIIDIATQAVKVQGITLNEVSIIYDDGNKLWSEKIGYISEEQPNHGILKEGFLKNYKTVFFDFKEPIKDIWVFIDKDTGEVLTVYREK